MSSQMFCELAALDTAELAKCGGDDGKVHRVTAGVVDSRICSFANDAPAGCWVVLQQQPVGAVLPQAEVLLVAVQAADTMWGVRAMTRKTYLQAVDAERFDQRGCRRRAGSGSDAGSSTAAQQCASCDAGTPAVGQRR